MANRLLSTIKPILKSVFLVGLVITLALGHPDGALAARSGGRIGGGSFRAPSRTYAPPSGGYYPGGGGYYPGGGIGFPFLLPFFGFGGGFGGVFSILIFLALANFLVQTFRRVSSGSEGSELGYGNPKVSVVRVQAGLLSQARSLQVELDEIARTADTGSAAGRAQVLQETTLALLRHPEYWVYGAAQSQQSAMAAAEAKFNQLALGERSKFTSETLSNVNNQLRQASDSLSAAGAPLSTEVQEPGEYIVVTIVVGAEGNLQLPAINSTEDLRQALRQIGGVSSDRLLALEVLWTPQAEGDTLTSDDLLAEYPDLKLV